MDFEEKYYEMALLYYRTIPDISKIEEYAGKLAVLRSKKIRPKTELSVTENEILKLVIQGKTNKEIGEIQYITHNTVKKHVSNILFKLECANRLQLIYKYKE
ncbi:MAG: helix-turn-helix transcriptional regulator [Candidatus Omnitrophica bacterium]|nr:helix-turn-helix transcriptional regulator [Candidatus Omnitrophota bacterium]